MPVPRTSVDSTSTPVRQELSRERRSELTQSLLVRAHSSAGPERDALLDEVVVINRCVAEAIASRYRGRGVPHDDLVQAASEGLVKAVRRFDPSVRPDLLTYAVPTMRGEVQRWFRDQSWMVRPPRRIQELQWRINRSSEQLAQQLGRDPSRRELVEDLGCEDSEVEEALQGYGCFTPASLDRTVGGPESEATLGDLLEAESDRGNDGVEARTILGPVVRGLSARDRRIIYLRFFEERTQHEIGAEFGVTQMQVSRLIARILTDLRRALDDSALSA